MALLELTELTSPLNEPQGEGDGPTTQVEGLLDKDHIQLVWIFYVVLALLTPIKIAHGESVFVTRLLIK